MAYFSISSVQVNGMAAAVPKNTVHNNALSGFEADELQKLITTLGIEQRRVALPHQTAADLCVAAAEQLIQKLNWQKEDIEVVFFVSQTPDYNLPGTSLHIQERLGLPRSCVTFDINQGCAGYVYGLSLISSFMSASQLKKGLLLVGDTITKLIQPNDKSLTPLFADAGTATALSYDEAAADMYFNLSSEGKDYEAIIVKQGGARQGFQESEAEKEAYLQMKGLEVFNFSLSKVAPNAEELMKRTNTESSHIHYFVFHQANKLIVEAIAKKLNIPAEKVPMSLKRFGNTSGATIPLTLVTTLSENGKLKDAKLLLSGFGVGLSIASAIISTKNVVSLPLIEMA
jgi:3-oxoacyl-[acyl-carrier-protein] synthase III